jgi:hypothetical protein
VFNFSPKLRLKSVFNLYFDIFKQVSQFIQTTVVALLPGTFKKYATVLKATGSFEYKSKKAFILKSCFLI